MNVLLVKKRLFACFHNLRAYISGLSKVQLLARLSIIYIARCYNELISKTLPGWSLANLIFWTIEILDFYLISVVFCNRKVNFMLLFVSTRNRSSHRSSTKKTVLKYSYKSQENTYARASFLSR